MDLSRPYAALCPTLDADVLVALARTRRPLTGREMARLLGRSHVGVNDALTRLTEQGLVDREEAATALLYTLNREHVAAPAAEILAGLRGELLHRLTTSLARWTKAPVSASMFGSAARGDGDTHSDVDIFVVRPAHVDDNDPVWRDQIDALSTAVRRWTGNHAGIAEVGEAEIPRLREEQPPIVQNLLDDAVDLYGDARELLRARA